MLKYFLRWVTYTLQKKKDLLIKNFCFDFQVFKLGVSREDLKDRDENRSSSQTFWGVVDMTRYYEFHLDLILTNRLAVWHHELRSF